MITNNIGETIHYLQVIQEKYDQLALTPYDNRHQLALLEKKVEMFHFLVENTVKDLDNYLNY